MSFDMNSLWGVLTIIGPIVLVVAIVWAMTHNRGTPREERATEQATRDMYDAQAKADKEADER